MLDVAVTGLSFAMFSYVSAACTLICPNEGTSMSKASRRHIALFVLFISDSPFSSLIMFIS